MKRTALIIIAFAVTFSAGFFFQTIITKQPDKNTDIIHTDNYHKTKKEKTLKLGAFSVSLNVEDIKASRRFYENLGFRVFGGEVRKNYLILKNENSLIGLFHGMFENNILTFNPGWDESAHNMEEFDDVRKIQRELKNKSIRLTAEADEHTTGPAYIMLTDPDGNTILIDQHR